MLPLAYLTGRLEERWLGKRQPLPHQFLKADDSVLLLDQQASKTTSSSSTCKSTHPGKTMQRNFLVSITSFHKVADGL